MRSQNDGICVHAHRTVVCPKVLVLCTTQELRSATPHRHYSESAQGTSRKDPDARKSDADQQTQHQQPRELKESKEEYLRRRLAGNTKKPAMYVTRKQSKGTV